MSTKYYGVKCALCGKKIPLAVKAATKGRVFQTNFVPLVPVICPKCGYSQQYEAADALDFDDEDGLLDVPPPHP